MAREQKQYEPRRFNLRDTPRIGQRIRFAPEHAEGGDGIAVYSTTTHGAVGLPVGSLVDVVAIDGELCDVDAYVKDGDDVVTHRLEGMSLQDFLSVKGRPFVAGVDDRRGVLPNMAESGTTRPKAVAVPRSPSPAPAPVTGTAGAVPVPADALEALRTVLGGVGTDEAKVREIATEVTEAALDPVSVAVADLSGNVATQSKSLADVQRKLDDALDALSTASAPVKARVRAAVAGVKSGTGNPIVDVLSRYYVVGEDRMANVLLASPPSLGKSFAVREYGRMYDLYLEHGCSDDVDEIATLLGSPMPDGRGGFVVTDGVVSQAVRAASDGKSVLLLLDEVLRLSPRAQEWLLSFLTGRKRPDGSRYYELRTRRVLADGTLEVLACEATNLHIVAATNLGMIAPVEAFWSRWETVRLNFDPATVRAVSLAVLGAFGYSDAVTGKLAAAWTSIVTESRKEVARGTLRFPADIRMLERAAALVSTGKSLDVARELAGRLTDNLANWSADLGDTDPESSKVCGRLAAMLAL